jgi:hypothetical protein
MMDVDNYCSGCAKDAAECVCNHSAGSLGCAPMNKEKNGAYTNQYGRIYLRIIEKDEEGRKCWVDHGISLAEAIAIRNQLNMAIDYAAELETGRCVSA